MVKSRTASSTAEPSKPPATWQHVVVGLGSCDTICGHSEAMQRKKSGYVNVDDEVQSIIRSAGLGQYRVVRKFYIYRLQTNKFSDNVYKFSWLAGDTGGSAQVAPATEQNKPKGKAEKPEIPEKKVAQNPKSTEPTKVAPLQRSKPLTISGTPEKAKTKRTERATPQPMETHISGQTPIKSPEVKRVKATGDDSAARYE